MHGSNRNHADSHAADASTAPSIAGHAYNDLPVGNPDVTVTQIDNSALPATLRNPIGQNEGTNTPNDLSQNYYSADASTLEYDANSSYSPDTTRPNQPTGPSI